ncbi:MAG TPA: hypothetical protein PLM87_03225 [Bacteroidales bacterium]|nr:hypothetical protein [Bacteroidales bacterium]
MENLSDIRPVKKKILGIEISEFVIFLIVFVAVFFHIFFTHNRRNIGQWEYPIWADAAAYFVYLPATFIYHYDGSKMPENIPAMTGDGFHIENNKIVTKVAMGVAILQAPFYAISYLIANIFDINDNGFGKVYIYGLSIGAAFYFTLGLVFLYLFLKRRFSKNICFITLLLIIFGTNLYYYTYEKFLYSHLYSFFIFSVSLYLIDKLIKTNFKKKIYIALFGIILSLAFLVRYTNPIFIVLMLLFLDIDSWQALKQRFKNIFNIKFISITAIIFIIILLPQMFYWHYLVGKFLYYSYGNEGFNWLEPKFLEFFFSPNNGAFIYTPLYLIIFIYAIIMSIKKEQNGLLILSIFLIASYIFASWWSWSYGCSLGKRPFVELTPIFSICIASLADKIIEFRKPIISIILSLVLLFSTLFSFSLNLHYAGCSFVSDTWDWNEYKLIVNRSKFPLIRFHKYEYSTDFEYFNNELYYPFIFNTNLITKSDTAYSGQRVCKLNPNDQYSFTYRRDFGTITVKDSSNVDFNIKYFFPNSDSNKLDAYLVIQVEEIDSVVYYTSKKLEPISNEWIDANIQVGLPKFPNYFVLVAYVLNDSSTVLLDDFKLTVRF